MGPAAAAVAAAVYSVPGMLCVPSRPVRSRLKRAGFVLPCEPALAKGYGLIQRTSGARKCAAPTAVAIEHCTIERQRRDRISDATRPLVHASPYGSGEPAKNLPMV